MDFHCPNLLWLFLLCVDDDVFCGCNWLGGERVEEEEEKFEKLKILFSLSLSRSDGGEFRAFLSDFSSFLPHILIGWADSARERTSEHNNFLPHREKNTKMPPYHDRTVSLAFSTFVFGGWGMSTTNRQWERARAREEKRESRKWKIQIE